MKSYAICYDTFFDGIVERVKSVFFAYGLKGELDKYQRDLTPDAKRYWYCAREDAPALLQKMPGDKISKSMMREAIDMLLKDESCAIPDKEMELVGGSCFDAYERRIASAGASFPTQGRRFQALRMRRKKTFGDARKDL